MAGIILSLGHQTKKYIQKIRQHFEFIKELEASYEFFGKECQLIKYKRRYDKEDHNFFKSPDIVLCAVGSILYRSYGFENSIKEIGISLSKGAKLSEIIYEIDGTFCLIIISKKENKCHIVTDIGGVINTYYYEKNHIFFLSTSMLALAKSLPFTAQLEQILMFIRSGMFFDETTYFKEINVLKPASIYEYNFGSGLLERKEYWSVPKEVNEHISFKGAADSITKSLRHIIDAIPNDKAIYDFTGGYDSRFALALAYGSGKKKSCLNAFFFGPRNSREAKIVEENCRNLCIKYNNYVVQDDWPQKFYDYVLESNNLSDGLENACAYAQVLLNQKLKRKHFQYSVHGPFGELFRQRRWITEFGKRGKNTRPNLARLIKYRDLTDDHDEFIYSKEWAPFMRDVPNKLEKIYEKTLEVFHDKSPNTLQLDYIYFYQRARRWGGRTITTANQIIQPICPLWFRRPLEISFALPPDYKKMSKLMRYIVEKESPRFAREQMITGAPFLQINLRNLFRFMPTLSFFSRIAIRKFSQIAFNKTIWSGLTTPDYNTGEWYRDALKDPRCQDLLNYDNMVSKSFYNKKKFNEFIKRAKSHEFHFYGQLGNIITVELTLRSVNLKLIDDQFDKA